MVANLRHIGELVGPFQEAKSPHPQPLSQTCYALVTSFFTILQPLFCRPIGH